jgi:hypothetical protein
VRKKDLGKDQSFEEGGGRALFSAAGGGQTLGVENCTEEEQD